MRARNREINIFSLSLMDVLSGAMGAFLIIMLILMRYYVDDPEAARDVDAMREKLDAAIAGLESVRGGTEEIFSDLIESETGATTRGLATGEALDQIEALSRGVREDIDRVSSHLAAVHAEANRLESELQEKSAQLKRASDQIERYEMRHPLVATASWDCPANVDLFLESDRRTTETGERGVAFDPRVRGYQGFTGDASSDTTAGPGNEMSLVSETPKLSTYKIFVNLLGPPADADCIVIVHALGFDAFFAMPPPAVLTAARPFDYLGYFAVGEAFELAYHEPSAEERAAEIHAVNERVASTPASAN